MNLQDVNENIVNELQEKSKHANRITDKGFISDISGSSVRVNDKGDVTIASSKTVQYKLKYDQGAATEVSMQSNTITNRKNIKTEEIIVNKHKLNPQIYELTDMRVYDNDEKMAIGNFTVNGTVLVKTWEANLKKWVLVRRPVRVPLFSNLLNIPSVPKSMNINDDISDEIRKMTNLR